MNGIILVVDDEEQFLALCQQTLSDWGYQVETAHSAAEAIDKCSHTAFDLAIADLRMPDLNGLDLLREMKTLSPDTEVVIVTGYADIETAVEAMKEGACDFISKPLRFDKLHHIVRRALVGKTIYHTRSPGEREYDGHFRCGHLLGKSKKMQEVFWMIEQVSQTESGVFLLGETGTGKRLTARTIHEISRRSTGPFISVTCGSLPENLFEGKLFGRMRGSLAEASTSKIGLLEAASGGTIFFDEIGCVSPHTQANLLDVLQDKESKRDASAPSQGMDVRIVAATSMDPVKALEKGTFHEDFYYHICPATIPLPLLRERVEDIPLLASHFLNVYCSKSGRSQRTLSPRALELMMKYPWPGNVRELEQIIEQVVSSSRRTVIRPADLPPVLKTGEDGAAPAADVLSEVEKDHILRVLETSRHNISQAARVLGLSRQALYRRLDKHGLRKAAKHSRMQSVLGRTRPA